MSNCFSMALHSKVQMNSSANLSEAPSKVLECEPTEKKNGKKMSPADANRSELIA
jgi:hypothetical protein